MDRKPVSYCTYFDANYLPRGLAMIESLLAHSPDALVTVLCLDSSSYLAVRELGIEAVSALSLQTLEAAYPELVPVQSSRSVIEYYFTLTPFLVSYLLRDSAHSYVTYLDADLYFFADPRPIYAENLHATAFLSEHGFPAGDKRLTRFGRFNVGWVSFQNSGAGRELAEWWRDRCLEWCYDKAEDGRFADQGYLNTLPMLSEQVHVITNPGANVAPWNTEFRNLDIGSAGEVRVDGASLLFFHFHGLRLRGNRLFSSERQYGSKMTSILRDHVYGPYAGALQEYGFFKQASRYHARNRGFRRSLASLYRLILDARAIVSHEFVSLDGLEK